MFDHFFPSDSHEGLQLSDFPFGDFFFTNMLRELMRNVLSLNRTIEFSPLIATIIFFIASVNFVSSNFWRHAKRFRYRSLGAVFGRGFLIFLIYHYAWLPVNRQIACLVRLVFHASDQSAAFVSVNVAILYFIASVVYNNARTGRRRSYRRSGTFLTSADRSKQRSFDVSPRSVSKSNKARPSRTPITSTPKPLKEAPKSKMPKSLKILRTPKTAPTAQQLTITKNYSLRPLPRRLEFSTPSFN